MQLEAQRFSGKFDEDRFRTLGMSYAAACCLNKFLSNCMTDIGLIEIPVTAV